VEDSTLCAGHRAERLARIIAGDDEYPGPGL